jgi:hypothetical protein
MVVITDSNRCHFGLADGRKLKSTSVGGKLSTCPSISVKFYGFVEKTQTWT